MASVTTKQPVIFISYKPEDLAAAQQIKSALKFLGREKLRVSLVEHESGGLDLLTERLPELAEADILLLLYTDPHQDWNLCVYESGFFSGKHFPDPRKRLIVLRNEEVTIPWPLSLFDQIAVSSTNQADVERLLKELFVEPIRDDLEPVFPELMNPESSAFRNQLVNTIVTALSGLQETVVFAKEISIEVPEKSLNLVRTANTNDMPTDARVFADRTSFALFALKENPRGYTWSEFYHNMDERSDNTQDWTDALVRLLMNIAFSQNIMNSTGLPLYRFSYEGFSECYRPAIRSFRRKRDLLTYRIVFIDLPREMMLEGEGPTTSLAQVLTLGRMLRLGVLLPFRDRLDSLEKQAQLRRTDEIPPSALAKEYERFLDNLLTVYVEARNRGYQRREMLRYFEGNEVNGQVKTLIKKWDVLLAASPELLETITHGETKIDAVRKIVEEALTINKEYMVLFAQRYKEAIEIW